jgi:hypothetical protein
MKRFLSWIIRLPQAALLLSLAVSSLAAQARSQDPGTAPSSRQESHTSTGSADRTGRIALPNYSIAGRVQSVGTSCLPAGHEVVVHLAREGRSAASQRLILDATGNVSFRFELGSHPMLAPGRYTVRIEKGSPNPSAYTCTANVCLDSITPGNRSVTLDAEHPNAGGQDFTIRYSIAWDRAGWCW